MRSHYEYATLWEKGEVCPFQTYTLVVESVICGGGPVFMAMLSVGDDNATCAVKWFYEDVLSIVEDHGVASGIGSTLKRRMQGTGEDYLLVLYRGRKRLVFQRGETFRMLAVGKKEGVLLCSAELLNRLSGETIINGLGKHGKRNKSIDELKQRLEEFRLRAISRGEEGNMAAVYVRDKRRD